jgi:hypothetical protein
LEAGRRIAATGSSDAHRIQYNWAGYPRTMVRVPNDAAPVDPAAIVESLKRGRAVVTSGPIVDLEVRADGAADGARPGEDVELRGKRARAHVVVHAAPWIDVGEVVLVVNGVVAERVTVPSRPTGTGNEPGTLDEARARARRYEGDLDVPEDARWLIVIVRGRRTMDDVLPFMPVVPFAFTNPVWIKG